MSLLLSSLSSAYALNPPTKVLLISGDWKSQDWYQKDVMGGKIFRGQFIAEAVNQYAPGEFHFDQITNYEAQEYLNPDFLRRYDVILMGDVMGTDISPSKISALKDFVKNGGGFVYCASYKWNTNYANSSCVDEALPAKIKTSNFTGEDWKNWSAKIPEHDFEAHPKTHEITRGLNWSTFPKLKEAFAIEPRKDSYTILNSEKNFPIFVVGQIGKGRAAVSASIFANDELSPSMGSWGDAGKFYARLFRWLGKNSQASALNFLQNKAKVEVLIDATKPKSENSIPKLCGFNSAVFPPNLGPRLEGTALRSFEELAPQGTFTRVQARDFERSEGSFDFKRIDDILAESERLQLQPEFVFDDVLRLRWMWRADQSWKNPTQAEIEKACSYVYEFLKHVNGGTARDKEYKPRVKFIEFGNEPSLDGNSINGFAKLYSAVRRNVHENFPGVEVGVLGGYEIPYARLFLEAVNGEVDFIARHPYGWTPKKIFEVQDDLQRFAKENGYKPIRFFITEWDFWICGAPKFDYLMKRQFAAIQRKDLIGALHYRLDQYAEPIYLFGALWANWGPGKGKAGMPIPDTYNPMWLFKNTFGQHVDTTIITTDSKVLKDHVYAATTTSDQQIDSVIYYDHGELGKGCRDYETNQEYKELDLTVKLTVVPESFDRKIFLSFADESKSISESELGTLRKGEKSASISLKLTPHSGAHLRVGPVRVP